MGRHALLEAPDVPAVAGTESIALLSRPPVENPTIEIPVVMTDEVRSVAEIIAQFRREQGLPELPSHRAARHDDADDEDVDELDTLVISDTAVSDASVSDASVSDTAVSDASAGGDRVDAHDDDDPSGPPHRTTRHGDTGELAAVRARRDAAWQSALRPAGNLTPRRRRSASGSTASSMIASLTAELAASHPGLLEGSPHSRRAESPAKRTHVAGHAAAATPGRVSTSLRGAAIRMPALAGGWRVPPRTPLVLAGAVAVSVVVTDQAGLLSTAEPTAVAASATVQQQELAATVQSDQAAASAASAAAASEGARQARARVSRLERSPITTSATEGAVAPAGSAATTAAVTAAPPPDSVMKPGQTVPGDWVRPTAKGIYNSCFCARWGTFHEGIDFAAPLGSPILAVGDGVVVQAGPASGFGNWVIIRHDNGDMTIYGHMKYYFVTIGQHVKAGQEIALVGEEGEATGPHLHLGVKIGSTTGHDGTYVDPVPWLVARGISVGAYNENG